MARKTAGLVHPHNRGATMTVAMNKKKQKSRSRVWLFLLGLLVLWFAIAWSICLLFWKNRAFDYTFLTKLDFFQDNSHTPETKQDRKPEASDHVTVKEHLLGVSKQIHFSSQQWHDLYHTARKEVQDYLQHKIQRKSLPLTAYLEQPLPPYDETKLPRLPLRTNNRPEDLKSISFNDIFHTCSDIPNDFPVVVPYEDNGCPVQADPFLPWIHDAFVSQSANTVIFVAHNQRRCNTDPKEYFDRLQHLEPQATLFQSVPIKRVTNATSHNSQTLQHTFQYQLTSLEEADADAKETRFICQFHTQLLLSTDDEDRTHTTLQKIIVGETLSTYLYNYEHANYQKNPSHPIITRPVNHQDTKNALHNEQVWNSILQFQCPVPTHLQALLSQSTKQDDMIPSMYVDIVPIRTYPRTDRPGYFDRTVRNMSTSDVTFDPNIEWGVEHLLPPVTASGRWANIPLCRILSSSERRPSAIDPRQVAISDNLDKQGFRVPQEHDFLVACVWASASFTTRGSSDPDTSTSDRLLEWLTYNLYMAEFDHIYVYDNSKGNLTLKPIVNLFPDSKVTLIRWKHPVCNNNRPGHSNPGERSSQYAAEASCRLRYGQSTEWMAVFDNDEYFIPQEPYKSIKQWLLEKHNNGHNPTKVLSFYQTRAVPNIEAMDPIPSIDNKDNQYLWKKKPDTTYMETYNCDRVPFPKPGWAWRAKKQIFQPSSVLYHFVHYSLVTTRLLEYPNEACPLFNNRAPLEERVDEVMEAFLLHTKATSPDATRGWKHLCRPSSKEDPKKQDKNNCPVGIPFPPGATGEGTTNTEGYLYNCYKHDRVQKEFAPSLQRLVQPFQERRAIHKRLNET